MKTNLTYTNILLFICFLGTGFYCSQVQQTAEEYKAMAANDTAVVQVKQYIDSLETENKDMKEANLGYTRFFDQLKDDCDTVGVPCCQACARLRLAEIRLIK